jgi:hypothetical protein
MTGPVQRVLVTADSSLAYVQCVDSDEVGVIDMRTGAMMDLLTHDNKVGPSFTCSAFQPDTAVQPALTGHLLYVASLCFGLL